MSVERIVGGIVGAIIGFIVGGPSGAVQGAIIGSSIGGVLEEKPGIKGPRLEDLRPQSSEYGRPIALVYGTAALQGNVIWATDLVEVEESTGGSKDGGEVTTYSYYANFAVSICEGEVQLGRIWAGFEKRLIWDGINLEGGGNITFYTGSETQMPDPLMESFEGVGNVPAYRGTSYVVFENFPVEKDGNRIPFLQIEVINPNGYTIDGWTSDPESDTSTIALGTVWNQGKVLVDTIRGTYIWTYSGGSSGGIIVRRLSDDAFVRHVSGLSNNIASTFNFHDRTRNRYVASGAGLTIIDLDDGSEVYQEAYIPEVGSGHSFISGCYHTNGQYVFLVTLGGNDGIVQMDPDTFVCTVYWESGSEPGYRNGLYARAGDNGSVFAAGLDGYLHQIPLGTTSWTSINLLYQVMSNPALGGEYCDDQDPNTGFFWSAHFTSYTSGSPGTLTTSTVNLNTGVNLGNSVFEHYAWDWAHGGARRAHPFAFDTTTTYIIMDKWLATEYFLTLSSGLFSVPEPAIVEGRYHGTGEIGAGFYNPTQNRMWWIRFAGWMNRDTAGGSGLESIALWANDNSSNPSPTPLLEPGIYMGDRSTIATVGGGIVTTEPTTLAQIVSDLCDRAGVASSGYDVTQLTDSVDGYIIASQVQIREAIRALMPPYYFDAVESNGVIKFVKRGGAIAVTIPDADLAAHESGSDPNEPLEVVRRMENELPRTLSLRYINANADYSTATRQAARLIGGSREESTMDLPLVCTDAKAQEVVETVLHHTWVGRRTYRLTLSRKYSYLEPTDCVSVKSQRMMLLKIKQKDGVLEAEAIFDGFSYVPNVVVTETPTSGKTVAQPTQTILELA